MPRHLVCSYRTLGRIGFISFAFSCAVDTGAAVPSIDGARRLALQERLERAELTAHGLNVEESVLRELVEWKLRCTIALANAQREAGFTDPSPEQLSRELARRASLPRAAQALGHVFTALENDAFLIEEVWLRPRLLEERMRSRHHAGPNLGIGSDAKEPFGAWLRQHAEAVASLELPAVSTSRGAAPELNSATSCLPDDTWVSSILSEPVPRFTGSGVWTGTEMIVTNGLKAYRYSLATDRWTATSPPPNPMFRSENTIIWTGSRLILWGGSNSNTGLIYNPSTDQWVETSTVGAPTARGSATAVWTGSEMLIWGGSNGVNLNTGGRYNPVTDTWQPITTTNAPSARSTHAAVWTGTRMIVWGGFNATGGRYDPQTDTWTPTSLVNAPERRDGTAAVWSGNEMVVWGGSRNGTSVGTGGRYNPASDSWRPITLTNAPNARAAHRAVWSSTRMIIHGGSPSPAPNSSYLYDPVADSWESTAPEPFATSRNYHLQFWDGSGMIVWGGVTANSRLRINHLMGARWRGQALGWTRVFGGDPSEPVNTDESNVWAGSRWILAGEYGNYFPSSFDPDLDQWRNGESTPLVGLDDSEGNLGTPEDRSFAAATWSGKNAGFVTFVYRAVSLYDPLLDRWSYGSTAGIGTSVEKPKHRWTGKELLACGGTWYDEGTRWSASWEFRRYDAKLDRWELPQAVNPLSKPIWCGQGDGETLVDAADQLYAARSWWSTGPEFARFNPTSKSWDTVPRSNVPPKPGNLLSCEQWSGTYLVRADHGDRYDPVTQVWSPISDVGRPPYAALCCAWSGREILMLTPTSMSSSYPHGPLVLSIYNPANDTWRLAPPSPWLEGTATRCAWTGNEMLVWASDRDRSGGRYALHQAEDNDGDGASDCAGDCNDGDPNVRPGGTEQCNGSDDDCDGLIDEGVGDSDADGVIDCQDNCPFTANSTQLDDDDDGRGNACDCATQNPAVWGVPPEPKELLPFDSRGYTSSALTRSFGWKQLSETAGSQIWYDVESGVVGQWPIGQQPGEVCVAQRAVANDFWLESRPDPPPGTAHWFLIRSRTSCGASSYGTASNGVPRLPNKCQP